MLITAEDREPVLERESRDPGVVGGNRTAGAPERYSQRRISHRRLLGDGKDLEVSQLRVQPCLVFGAMPGRGNAVTELAQHDDWNRCPRLPPQSLAHAGFSVDEAGQRVGVQDQARSSGSMTSKCSSILARMRSVSS